MPQRLKATEPDLVELLKDADPQQRLEGLRIAYGPRNKRAWALLISSVGGALWAGYYLLQVMG